MFENTTVLVPESLASCQPREQESNLRTQSCVTCSRNSNKYYTLCIIVFFKHRTKLDLKNKKKKKKGFLLTWEKAFGIRKDSGAVPVKCFRKIKFCPSPASNIIQKIMLRSYYKDLVLSPRCSNGAFYGRVGNVVTTFPFPIISLIVILKKPDIHNQIIIINSN